MERNDLMFIVDKILTMLVLPTALMTECALLGPFRDILTPGILEQAIGVMTISFRSMPCDHFLHSVELMRARMLPIRPSRQHAYRGGARDLGAVSLRDKETEK